MRVEGPSGPQVGTRVVSGPQADRVDVGAREVGSALGDVADVLTKASQKADEAAAEEALTAFEREKNDLFMNPDTGYFSRSGKDAYEKAGPVKSALEGLKETYAGNLKSPRARALFSEAATRHVTNGMAQVDLHALKGLRGWEAANAAAELETILSNATLYWNQAGDPEAEDPKARFGPLQVGEERSYDAIRRKLRGEGIGEDPETVTNAIKDFQSKYYASAVKGALRSSAEDAQKLFDRFGDKITGPERNSVLDAIAGRNKVEAEANQAALVTGTAQQIYQSLPDREEGLKAAMSLEDKAIGGKVTKELMYLYSQKETADREVSLDTYKFADEWLRSRPGATVAQYIEADKEGWGRLTPAQKARLESKDRIKSDLVWFHNTVTLPDEELLKVSIEDAMQKLDDDKLAQFTNAYKAAANRTRKGQSPDKSTIAVEAHVGVSNSVLTKRAAESILGNSRDWTAEDNRKAALFYAIVDDRARQLAGPDKKLTSQEFSELLKDTSMEVKKQGKLFGFEYTTEYTLDDVPYEEQLRIRKFLKENGKAQNATNIIRAWKEGIGEEPEEE